MPSFIHTEADLDAALAALGKPMRASSPRSPRRAGRRCGGAPTVSPDLPPSSWRSSFRRRARMRSGGGLPRPSIRSSRRRSCGHGRRSWRGSGCRRRKSARSKRSPMRSRAARSGAAHLADLAAEDAHAALTAVHGIGPWTADIYLLSCLGHADAWPAGDLALQEAARVAFALPARPSTKEMQALAESWRPWRAVAARVLWSYYRAVARPPSRQSGGRTEAARWSPAKRAFAAGRKRRSSRGSKKQKYGQQTSAGAPTVITAALA